MQFKHVIFLAAICGLFALGAFACEDDTNARTSTDADSDGDSDSDSDGDTDSDSDPFGPPGDISGVVMAPNGNFPISGALVYLTSVDAPPVEDNVYCYECEDMTNKHWTLSNADGTWALTDVNSGTWNVVMRKGMFQRQRQVTVVAGTNTEVAPELTSMPNENSSDGLDHIPNYAVLLTTPDQSHYLMAKLGLYTGSAGSSFPWGQETFDIYTNDVTQPGYPNTAQLFSSQATLDHYHMIFLPCSADNTGLSFVDNNAATMQNYVAAGGKIYNSCTVAYWTETPFPAYIEYYGNDDASAWDIGRYFSSAQSTTGTIVDGALRDWLTVVQPDTNMDAYPFVNGYALVDALVNVDDGHGLEENGGVVMPYSWVNGSSGDAWQGLPLMMTYNYDCGKVFYSIYETTGTGANITPQEYVLLYIIMEVGVCEGDYIIE